MDGFVIRSSDDHSRASDYLRFVKVSFKKLKEARDELVKPSKDKIKQIDDVYQPILLRLKDAEGYTKSEVVRWSEAEAARIEAERVRVMRENQERERLAREADERAKREAAEQASREADEAGLDETQKANWIEDSKAVVQETPVVMERLPDAPLATTHSALGSITMRKSWDFQIVSFHEVPRTYCSPDPKLIREAVQAGVREISGVRIFEKSIVASSRNRN
jgi:hypothetical protein